MKPEHINCSKCGEEFELSSFGGNCDDLCHKCEFPEMYETEQTNKEN